MKDEDYALYQAMAQVTEQDKSRAMTREFLSTLLQSGGAVTPYHKST